MSGSRVTSSSGFVEHFRLDASRRFIETQFQLVSGGNVFASRKPEQFAVSADANVISKDDQSDRSLPQTNTPQPVTIGPLSSDSNDTRKDVRRDPDYVWGERPN